MQNMSRKAKYEKLRQELQNDAESQISTKGISAYAERLSRLDTTATEQLEVKEEENHDPIHLRREAYFADETQKEKANPTAASFNNEYLDEYISEVKEYNKQRGLLASEDTQVNILKQLREQSSIRPFEEKMVSTSKDNLLDDMDIPSFVLPEDDTLRNTISMEVKQLLDQSGNSGEMLKTLEPAPTPEIKKSRRKKPRISSRLSTTKTMRKTMTNGTTRTKKKRKSRVGSCLAVAATRRTTRRKKIRTRKTRIGRMRKPSRTVSSANCVPTCRKKKNCGKS